jgi:hypothetical protein
MFRFISFSKFCRINKFDFASFFAVLRICIGFNADLDTDPDPAFLVNADPDPGF